MKKILVCNQKMYLTYDEAINLKEHMEEIDMQNIDLIICPNYLNFDVFKDYDLGAQNCFYENKGAFTGEISSYDLSLRGIKYVLVGHSERRKYDTLDDINLKIKSILRNSMIPILCVGEEKIDKELMKTGSVIKKQLTTALKDVYLENDQQIIIAYEPRYLIGGKNTLNKDNIIDTFKYIRKIMNQLEIENYSLLYGGSVHSENFNDINSDDIDGFLLGASSVDIQELKNIVKCIK